ncbi:MAG: phosphoribosylformylglycinamidine cyclo-ligase [Chloroflexi bacterium]|nr:phosphoribosylformylglycinamidine cyclo-ligase [Chloroflexota bacterium]
MTRQTYAKAGVDIALKAKVISRIGQQARSTLRPEVLSGIGPFGGMYEFKGYKEPVLVSSVDGVGTKTRIANAVGKHNTIGMDIVNHCVNDILTCGSKPLFFLDYIGTGKVVPQKIEAIASGLAQACREADCVLIGGETAEMPGIYSGGDYDLVGFIIGVVEKRKIIDTSQIAVGDAVLGLPSSGLHTNGYSLVRKIFGETKRVLNVHYAELGKSLGEALLEPHRSYYYEIKKTRPLLKGIAHITGGGIIGNLSRILPKELSARLDSRKWTTPPLFQLIQEKGNIETREMYRVFNMGIGMVLVCSPDKVGRLTKALPEARVIGEIIPRKSTARVIIDGKGYRSDKVL